MIVPVTTDRHSIATPPESPARGKVRKMGDGDDAPTDNLNKNAYDCSFKSDQSFIAVADIMTGSEKAIFGEFNLFRQILVKELEELNWNIQDLKDNAANGPSVRLTTNLQNTREELKQLKVDLNDGKSFAPLIDSVIKPLIEARAAQIDENIKKLNEQDSQIANVVSQVAEVNEWRGTMTNQGFSITEEAFTGIQRKLNEMETTINVRQVKDATGQADSPPPGISTYAEDLVHTFTKRMGNLEAKVNDNDVHLNLTITQKIAAHLGKYHGGQGQGSPGQ